MERMHEARTWRRSLCQREKTWKLLVKGCEETFGFICFFVYFYHRWNFLMGKQAYGVGITPRWARERTGILTWTSLLHNLVLYLPVLWTTLPISKNSGDIPVFKGNPASEGHCLQSKHSWLEAKTKHMFPEDWSLKHFRSAWSLKATSHPSELDLKTQLDRTLTSASSLSLVLHMSLMQGWLHPLEYPLMSLVSLWGFPHFTLPDPQLPFPLYSRQHFRLKPFLISHPEEGSWMSIGSDLIPLASPLPPPAHCHFICMASWVLNCAETCSRADTRAQALTSHTFSCNSSSACGIHLFVITGCEQYHCTGPMWWPRAMRKHISNFYDPNTPMQDFPQTENTHGFYCPAQLDTLMADIHILELTEHGFPDS